MASKTRRPPRASLSAEWQAIARRLPKRTPPNQKAIIRSAFFLGAATVLRLTSDLSVADEEVDRLLEVYTNEIEEVGVLPNDHGD